MKSNAFSSATVAAAIMAGNYLRARTHDELTFDHVGSMPIDAMAPVRQLDGRLPRRRARTPRPDPAHAARGGDVVA
jgi:hypothetical protein